MPKVTLSPPRPEHLSPKTPRHRRPDKEKGNPGSPYFVPNDADNRKGVDPTRARLPGPPYRVDVESLFHGNTLAPRPWVSKFGTALALAERIRRDPLFHLEGACRGCEHWVPTRYERPQRAGAVDNLQGCHGCVFALLDGVDGSDFANVNRDAAFSSWADARRKVAELEMKRPETKGEAAKERLDRQLETAWARLKKSAKRCNRLGFNPQARRLDGTGWLGPLSPPTHDRARRQRERAQMAELRKENRREKTSPSCRSCRNWTEDAERSGSAGTFGSCWVMDSATKASYWCADHNARG